MSHHMFIVDVLYFLLDVQQLHMFISETVDVLYLFCSCC